MRRAILAGMVTVTLTVTACSEQPTEVGAPEAPAPPTAALVTGCPSTPTSAQIVEAIVELVPPSPLRTRLTRLANHLPKKLEDRLKAAVRQEIFVIQDLVLRAYYAGALVGGTSPGTFDKVLRLIEALYCWVGLSPPELPGTTAGSDVVVGVVFPSSPTTTLVVPSEHAAVTIPTGAAPAATTIVISILPDETPPLRTSLDQYPFFYHFSGTTADGPVTFTLDVTAGICLRDDIDVPDADLRLAHNVAPFGFGDVEVLPRPASVPGLDCGDLPPESDPGPIGRIPAWLRERFAWAGRLLLPREAQASAALVATVGVGGTTKKFSEFGIVDVESGPASLEYHPDAGSFEGLSAAPGGTVSPAPSVIVRSAGGMPIPGVPVEFEVGPSGGAVNGGNTTTVLTDADGVATVASWTLGEEAGTYLLVARPQATGQDPPGESVTPPFRPAAAFTPDTLGFIAQAVVPAAVVGNGTVVLGVNPTGNLIALDAGPASAPEAFGEGSTTNVGLRLAAANGEALGTGILVEGWGLGHAASGLTGYASHFDPGSPFNLTVESFTATETGAVSVVRIGSALRVTHDFQPSTDTPNLYRVEVTVENLTAEALEGLVYRRVLDWDSYPTRNQQFVTIVGTTSTPGVSATNMGFASADPLVPPATSGGELFIHAVADFFDVGPFDHGAIIDVTLSTVFPGGTNTFALYYGAAATLEDAMTAAVGTEVVSFARPNVEPFDGSPNTFIFALAGLGGTPLTVEDMQAPAD